MSGAPVGEAGFARALDALVGALAFGIHPSLDGIRALTDALDRPQDAFRSVQVTGTNGKSSTARVIGALLGTEGVRTGLYTSPHLERYPERIEVAGSVSSDEEFAAAVLAVLEAAEALRPGLQGTAEGFTEFELLTAAALWHFRQHAVEVAVLEVGLGGTWDATSVVDPVVAVITGVGLDHAAILGDTIEEIASEKAGIIRRGSTVVLGPGTSAVESVLGQRARSVGAPVRRVRPAPPGALSLPAAGFLSFRVVSRPEVPGGITVIDARSELGSYDGIELRAPSYQAANVATALAAAESVLGRGLDPANVRRALGVLAFPGRFEIARQKPVVVVDGSHNPQAVDTLAGAIIEAWPRSDRRPDVLLGVLADKDAEGIVAGLVRSGAVLGAVCTPTSNRALPAAELARIVERVTGVRPATFESVSDALAVLVPSAGRGLVVTGSLTTAGEARARLREHT